MKFGFINFLDIKKYSEKKKYIFVFIFIFEIYFLFFSSFWFK